MHTHQLRRILTLSLLITVLILANSSSDPAAAAGPWYVAPGGNDSNDCLSTTTECASINGVLAKAGFIAGDTVKVASGYYTGTGYTIVLLDKDVRLLGGWNASFSTQDGASIIDGQNARRGIIVGPYGSLATAIIERFTIKDGNAEIGGGIINYSTLHLTNSTVSGNVANGGGGGILNYDIITLNNVTISNNNADGDSNGSGEGGGVNSLSGTVDIKNSIIAGNLAAAGLDCWGTIGTSGYNLIGNTSGCIFAPTLGDLIDLDAGLVPMIDSIYFHPLATTSPAINAGNPAGCTDHMNVPLLTDQRGVTRVGVCDIGSFEYTSSGLPDAIVAVRGTPQRTTILMDFQIPLQSLVLDNLGNVVDGETVTFTAPASGASGAFEDSGTYETASVTAADGIATATTFIANDEAGNYTVNASTSGLGSTADFQMTNAGYWYVSIDGDNSNDCFSSTTECASMNGVLAKAGFFAGDTIKVTSGSYTGTGSQVVLIDRDVTILGGWDDTFIVQNQMSTIDAENSRRGVTINAGLAVWMERFEITHGYSTAFGGGINSGSPNLTLSQISIHDNYAASGGAGISTTGGNVNIFNTTIHDNQSDGWGGGILSTGSTVTLRDSTISDNIGSGGAGIYDNCAHLIINNSTISGNVGTNPAYSGGGIAHACSGFELKLNNATISNNQADDAGGIWAPDAVSSVQNTIIASNTATTSPDCSGAISSAGYNILGDTSGCSFSTSTGDQSDVDPNIGILVGSPGYHPLSATSPARDAGNPSGCTDHLGSLLSYDQRGISRVGVCDIGAYEYTSPGAPDRVEAGAGTPQRALPLIVFAEPLQAVVLDSIGSPIGGSTVTYTAPATGASGTFADSMTNITTAMTDEFGTAVSSLFTANGVAGAFVVEASVVGIAAPAEFHLSTEVWHVSEDGDDGNDCLSPSTTCASVNAVFLKPEFVVEDTIRVAEGTYTGTGTEVILVDRGVILSGGWDASFSTQDGFSRIDGEGLRRGIRVDDSGANVVIDNFELVNGYSNLGGGLGVWDSVVSLNNSTVRDNYSSNLGGGIYIYSAGMLTINNSSISNNESAIGGGGIKNFGALTVNNSTIGGNQGSGIYNDSSGVLIINSSTLSDNDARGLYHRGSSATIQNTIIAGNRDPGPGAQDCYGNITSLGYNIIGDANFCNISATTGDQLNIDPQLGPLIGIPGYLPLSSGSPAIDNGNPSGCDGSEGHLTSDQRGAARVGVCDIGAYEYTTPSSPATIAIYDGSPQHAPPSFPFWKPFVTFVLDGIGSPVSGASVTFTAPLSGASGTFADSGTNTTSALTGEFGLAEAAIFTANGVAGSYDLNAEVAGASSPAIFDLTNQGWYVSLAGSDSNNCQTPITACATVNGVLEKTTSLDTFTALVASGTYTGSGDDIAILDHDVGLIGGWSADFLTQSGDTIFEGEGDRRSFNVKPGVEALIDTFVIYNNAYHSSLGGIHNDGNLTLINSTVDNCPGFGVKNNGYMAIDNVEIINTEGTGLYNTGQMIAENCNIENNNKWPGGAAGVFNGGDLVINYCTIIGNTADSAGGGITNSGTLTINYSTLSGNISDGDGGAIYVNDGQVTISNTTISSNSAYAGGGIYIGDGTVRLSNCTISSNEPSGLDVRSDAVVSINNCTIAGNTNPTWGGGINNVNGGVVDLQNSLLIDNTSPNGPDCIGPIGSAGYNLIGDTSGCTFTSTTGDLINIDADLTPLEDHGGSTLTHGLSPGSPAINAGNPAGCTDDLGSPLPTDQRGAPRVGVCDIGSYEAGLAAIKEVSGNFRPGGEVTFTLTLSNEEGTVDLTDVSLTDDLPASMTYVPGSYSDNNGTGSESGGVITWNGTVYSASNTVITFSADLDAGLPACSIVQNTAQITHDVDYTFEEKAQVAVACQMCSVAKYGSNPVFDTGTSGSWDEIGVSHPSVIKVGSTYWMWYAGNDGVNPTRIGLATSSDGVTWTREASNPVLSPTETWEASGVSRPSVLFDGLGYEMWYTGVDSGGVIQVGYATSSDGISWVKSTGNPVLVVGTGGSWDDEDVSGPTVIKDGHTYHMWFAGHDGSTFRIGHATSSNGIIWNKDPGNPVLDVGGVGDWDWLAVYSPEIMKIGDTYQLWYSGETIPQAWESGYAESSDGTNWTRKGMLIPEGPPGSFDTNSADHLAVLLEGDTYQIWYSGLDDGYTYTIGYAQGQLCPVGEYTLFLPLVMKDYSPAPPCPPDYADDFSDPESGWLVYEDADVKYDYTGGEYQIWLKNPSAGRWVTPGAKASDFTVAVSARRTSGTDGPYGILFGINEDWSELYMVVINEDYYDILRYDSGWTFLASASSPEILTGTAWNRIKVTRDGTAISLYINDQFQTTVYDGSFTGFRRIGLSVYSPSGSDLDARFDDFALYPASCGPIAADVTGVEWGEAEAHEGIVPPKPEDME
jgi:uncharacterized repeat protein (TIGR01451 family)